MVTGTALLEKYTGAAVGTILAAAASVFGYHCYLQYQRPGEPPIKWSWLPFLGFALEMGNEPFQLFKKIASEFDEIFGMITLGNRMFIITDPHSYNIVINFDPKKLSNQEFFDTVERNFFGIVVTEVENNLFRAGYSKHLFSDSGLAVLTERTQCHLQRLISSSQAGEFSMLEWLNRFIFEASVASIFNEAAGADPALFSAFNEFDKSLPIACAGLDIKHLSQANNSRSVLASACLRYREGESDFMASRWKLLQGWLDQGLLHPSDPSRYQLAMLWASVGNTMPANFWLLFFIVSNPSVYAKVVEEITRVCGGMEKAELIPISYLNQLVYINACITETLRLTSGSLIMRVVKESCSITLASGCSYRLRKGDHLGLFPPLTHLDDEVFAKASDFNPDRWLVGSNAEEVMESSQGRVPVSKGGKPLSPAMAFLPFGGGASLCPGRKFARNEMKTLIVYLMQHFDLSIKDQPHPGYDGSRCGLGIFPPKKDLRLHVALRI